MNALLRRVRYAPRFFARSWRNATTAMPNGDANTRFDKDVAKSIFMRLSRNSISSKMGKILSRDMIDKRWNDLLQYSFCD